MTAAAAASGFSLAAAPDLPPPPPAPAGLGAGGKSLWAELTAALTLRTDELAVLESACRTVDQIAALQRVSRGKTMVNGSKDQPVLHPAIAELRQQRRTLADLLGRLQVPEDPAQAQLPGGEWDGLSASQRGRKAALIRHRGGAA